METPVAHIHPDDTASTASLEGTDQAPVKPQSEKKQEDILDILVPKSEPKTWVIGQGDFTREYVQRPLGFIEKMQWFALVGGVLEKSMSGDNALSMNNLLSAPAGRGDALTMEDFRDADTFIQAVGKLLVEAPTFLQDSFCIWLSVPDYDRDRAKELMALPPEEGGLTDDQGLEIIEIFIDQNYEALDSFFREKLAALRKRVVARQKAAAESRSSKH
jgi:hypothetical protein